MKWEKNLLQSPMVMVIIYQMQDKHVSRMVRQPMRSRMQMDIILHHGAFAT